MKKLSTSIVPLAALMLLAACASHRPRCESLQPINAVALPAAQVPERAPDETAHEH
ncbi:MAG TPA: hypothetical protein VFB37_13220 [Steroidobacteraceae bacterium]|nr:hypothetical protein [Steroidobacteraceae bacterium]